MSLLSLIGWLCGRLSIQSSLYQMFSVLLHTTALSEFVPQGHGFTVWVNNIFF